MEVESPERVVGRWRVRGLATDSPAGAARRVVPWPGRRTRPDEMTAWVDRESSVVFFQERIEFMFEVKERFFEAGRRDDDGLMFFKVGGVGFFVFLQHVGQVVFVLAELFANGIDDFALVIGDEILKMIDLLFERKSMPVGRVAVKHLLEETEFTFPEVSGRHPDLCLLVHVDEAVLQDILVCCSQYRNHGVKLFGVVEGVYNVAICL